jgi:uncharacterized DUF497 family protein
MYCFEYDDKKSELNKRKHGLDFIEAQELWKDPEFIQIKANSDTESRYLVIGNIENKIWSAVITYRGEKIRIISVRRARTSEATIYES